MKARAGRLLAANETVFARLADCALASGPLQVKVDGLTVTVTAPKGAFYVWANAEGLRGEFDDNSISLMPGETRTLTFAPKGAKPSAEAFRAAVSVRHLGGAVIRR